MSNGFYTCDRPPIYFWERSIDWGMVWNSSGLANPTPNSLASVGLGLQWQQGDFTARLDWGIPLVSVDSIEGTRQESGLYFSVQYNR